jgi:CBS-domain-containing membrane protein
MGEMTLCIQGAFARRLTGHAIELSLILEDALRRSLDSPVVSDYMVRNPICADLWQPISFIRQQMLANSFSFLPVNTAQGWCLISDVQIATYLGTVTSTRKVRLAQSLTESGLKLKLAKLCAENTPLEEALRLLEDDQKPLLVHPDGNSRSIVGIVTPFDLLRSRSQPTCSCFVFDRLEWASLARRRFVRGFRSIR